MVAENRFVRRETDPHRRHTRHDVIHRRIPCDDGMVYICGIDVRRFAKLCRQPIQTGDNPRLELLQVSLSRHAV